MLKVELVAQARNSTSCYQAFMKRMRYATYKNSVRWTKIKNGIEKEHEQNKYKSRILHASNDIVKYVHCNSSIFIL